MNALFAVLLLIVTATGQPARVVFQPADGGKSDLPNLLRDGGFETADPETATWRPYGGGFSIEASIVHGGRRSIRCRAFDDRSTLGATTKIDLVQQSPRTVVIEAWTRAEGVTSAPSAEYSLYADLTFSDGTRQWGQFAACPTDAGGWRRVVLVLRPDRPIASVDLYCLFRNLRGTVWFDDVAVRRTEPGQGPVFDGEFGTFPTTQPDGGDPFASPLSPCFVLIQLHDPAGPVLAPPLRPSPPATAAADQPRDRVATFDLAGQSLRGRVIASAAARSSGAWGVLVVEIENDSPDPRPATVFLGRRFDARGGWWWDDGVRRRRIEAEGEYVNVVDVGAGKTRTLSRYPLAVVATERDSLALAPGRTIGPPAPTLARFAYHAGRQLLYAAFDVVLPAAGDSSPGRTQCVVQFRHGPARGFREAWAEAAPFSPPRRVPPGRIGLWMPFAAISRIERPEDFGFAFKEGIDDLEYDNAHGLLTFRYVEPQSFWLKLPPDAPRDAAACVAALRAAARDSEYPQHAEAAAALASACKSADGRFYVWPRREPWCDGAVFALNPAPTVPGEPTKARLNFDPPAAERYFADGVDGEYLDSLDGWADVLNFDSQHLSRAGAPLAFDPDTKRPCLLNAFSIWEYAAWLRARLDERGKLLMANYCPTRFWWMAPLFDVMGQETNWKVDGRWSPMSDAELWHRRALSGPRPYCLLMNTDFDRWTLDDTRRYMLRCAAYGILPGFFSRDAATRQYFETPALYNRDRPLFRQIVPLIREIAEAGWQPLPRGRAALETVRLERFGDDGPGPMFWTIHNSSDGPVRSEIEIELPAASLPPAGAVQLIELGSGRRVRIPLPPASRRGAPLRLELSLTAWDTQVIRCDAASPAATGPASEE